MTPTWIENFLLSIFGNRNIYLYLYRNQNKTEMTLLTQTPKEQERAQRDRRVAAEFQTLRKAYPTASAARIIRTIAMGGKFSLSEPGIKQILYRTGTITPNRKNA